MDRSAYFLPLLLEHSGKFHCPSGPGPALLGTLARLPGKAPDVTAERDPKQPPLSYPSFPCAVLTTFPSPMGSRLREK